MANDMLMAVDLFPSGRKDELMLQDKLELWFR